MNIPVKYVDNEQEVEVWKRELITHKRILGLSSFAIILLVSLCVYLFVMYMAFIATAPQNRITERLMQAERVLEREQHEVPALQIQSATGRAIKLEHQAAKIFEDGSYIVMTDKGEVVGCLPQGLCND